LTRNTTTRATDNAPDLPGETAIELLEEQDGLYARLETLAVRQHRLIFGDDPGRLLVLLAERRQLTEGLSRIAERLAPARTKWSAYREGLTTAQQDLADRLLSQTQGRLRRLMEGDTEDARLLSLQTSRAGEGLREHFSRSQAIQAYQGRGAAVGSRFDRPGEESET